MSRQNVVRTILGADEPDAGCDEGMEVLDVFVDAEVAGRPAAALFPAVAAHLAACADCREDHEALLDLVRRPVESS